MATKKLDIGLRQAKRLCNMKHDARLSFIAEGLPIILKSAQGFWDASCSLKEKPREADVLERFAVEEAVKILILMDAVRCPPKLLPAKIGTIVSWFYDHLARLIYAEAIPWAPMHVTQLREYVEDHRKAHYVDGSWHQAAAELLADLAERRTEHARNIREGLAKAARQGKKLGRARIDPAVEERAREMLLAGTGVAVVMAETGIGASTVTRIRREAGIPPGKPGRPAAGV